MTVPSSGSLALFCPLQEICLSGSIFYFIFWAIFVVSLYSNCVFEFNTESQNLSSNTSLFFPWNFFFKCAVFFCEGELKGLSSNWTDEPSLCKSAHICLFVFECSRIQSHSFIFEHQRSEICCKLSSFFREAAVLHHTYFLRRFCDKFHLISHLVQSVRFILEICQHLQRPNLMKPSCFKPAGPFTYKYTSFSFLSFCFFIKILVICFIFMRFFL